MRCGRRWRRHPARRWRGSRSAPKPSATMSAHTSAPSGRPRPPTPACRPTRPSAASPAEARPSRGRVRPATRAPYPPHRSNARPVRGTVSPASASAASRNREEASRGATHAQETPQQRHHPMADATQRRQMIGGRLPRWQIAQLPMVGVPGQPVAAALATAPAPPCALRAGFRTVVSAASARRRTPG